MALLAHLLVPAGYMPGPGGLMLCPAYDTPASDHSAMLDMPGMDMSQHGMPGNPNDNDKYSRHDASLACPFAAAAMALAGPPSLALAVRLGRQALTHSSVVIDSNPSGTIVPSPLPRGPPAFV